MTMIKVCNACVVLNIWSAK